MDDTLHKKILQALQAKMGNRLTSCPLCGGINWNIEPCVLNLRLDSQVTSGLVVGGPVYPVVVLNCKNCGEVRMVNIVVLLGKEALEDLDRLKRGTDIAQKALEP